VGTEREAELEERLVRVMADHAIRSATPIRYQELFDPAYDLDSFYSSYFPNERGSQFRALLRRIGMPEAEIRVYEDEYLPSSKHLPRRYLGFQ
jgi:hypothetical protein